jgi:phage baseplate assembly protein gpV
MPTLRRGTRPATVSDGMRLRCSDGGTITYWEVVRRRTVNGVEIAEMRSNEGHEITVATSFIRAFGRLEQDFTTP